MLPTIQNALNSHKTDSSENLDLRSHGPRQSKIGQMAQKCDPRSDRPHQTENGGISCKQRVDLPKVNSSRNNRNNHLKEGSVDTYESDEGYDNYMSHGIKFSSFEFSLRTSIIRVII